MDTVEKKRAIIGFVGDELQSKKQDFEVPWLRTGKTGRMGFHVPTLEVRNHECPCSCFLRNRKSPRESNYEKGAPLYLPKE